MTDVEQGEAPRCDMCGEELLQGEDVVSLPGDGDEPAGTACVKCVESAFLKVFGASDIGRH